MSTKSTSTSINDKIHELDVELESLTPFSQTHGNILVRIAKLQDAKRILTNENII